MLSFYVFIFACTLCLNKLLEFCALIEMFGHEILRHALFQFLQFKRHIFVQIFTTNTSNGNFSFLQREASQTDVLKIIDEYLPN